VLGASSICPNDLVRYPSLWGFYIVYGLECSHVVFRVKTRHCGYCLQYVRIHIVLSVFDLLPIVLCYVCLLYLLILLLACISLTPLAYGVAVFPCVWMLSLCSVLIPVFIVYWGGGRVREGACTVILRKFRVMLRIWVCVYQYVCVVHMQIVSTV
jgi:hypothetical protein